MFEIVKKTNLQNVDKDEYVLVHDDEDIPNVNIMVSKESSKFNKKFIIESKEGYETQYLIEFGLEEFNGVVSKFIFDKWIVIGEFIWKVEISTSNANFNETSNGIFLTLEPNLLLWDNSFSFANYRELFVKFYFELDHEDTGWHSINGDLLNITIGSYWNSKNVSLFKELRDKHEKLVKYIHFKIIQELNIAKSDNLIFVAFDFPEGIKFSCEQYLLYFAQFLRDLNIDATSDLKEKAGKVLFSVTPTDDIEALDKIREALAVYLNLPASPIVYDESFAAMRLQQQIENLQHSQKMAVREIRTSERELRLAKTVIESQDKIIIQKDSIIEQQNKVIEKIQSKSIMMDSLENKEEFEKVFEGLEIGESKILKEQIGIRFNPVTSLKTLGKKLIGKDDERKSVLGLDEED